MLNLASFHNLAAAVISGLVATSMYYQFKMISGKSHREIALDSLDLIPETVEYYRDLFTTGMARVRNSRMGADD